MALDAANVTHRRTDSQALSKNLEPRDTWRNHFRGAESFDEPSPLFAGIVERLLDGDPKYVSRLADLWQNAPPIKVKMRWSYRIVWQVPGFDVMRFQGFLSAANEPDGYMFYDWIPADATTWQQLDRLDGAAR